jgi:O-antigen/teichoic acid export membrane protein
MNQIKGGAILSYMLIGVNTLGGLLVTPLMIYKLGTSEFGIFALIGGFMAYFSVLDFGLANTVVRYTSKYLGEGDIEGQENFLAVCAGIYALITIIAFLAALCVLYNIDNLFGRKFTAEELALSKKMFKIVMLSVVVMVPIKFLSGIATAYERFIFIRSLSIFRSVIRWGAITILLLFGQKAIAIVTLDVGLSLVISIVLFYYVFIKLKVKVNLHNFERKLLVELFGYSFFVFLNTVIDQFYWRIGSLVLGIVSGTAAIAVYEIAIRLTTYYMHFSTAIAGLFLPRVTKMFAMNCSSENLTNLMIKTGRLQFLIVGYILGGFILFGKQFIDLWAGADYLQAYYMALIIFIPLTVPLIQNIGIAMLQAANKHAWRSIIYLAISVVNVMLGYFLAKKIEGIGIAIATASSLILGNIIAINLYYHYKMKINIILFASQVIRLLPALTISVITVYIITASFASATIMRVVLIAVFYSVLYFLLMWFAGLSEYEKDLLIRPLFFVRSRLKKLKTGLNSV